MTDIEQREPVAWRWEEYFTEWGTGTNGEYKHCTMWGDEKPTDHPDIRDVTPLYTGQQLAEVEKDNARMCGYLDALALNDAGYRSIRKFEDRATTAEAEAERLRALVEEGLRRISSPGTVAGMHEQDKADRLQEIARATLRRIGCKND